MNKEEHMKALSEGRTRYWNGIRAVNASIDALTECDKCTMIDWYANMMNMEIDREHCPIKCRYNKEVTDNGDNE